jgi:acetyl esterase/lipase
VSPRDRVERHRYGSGRAQFADLHLPAGDGPWPVAVVVHGGFWRAQYRLGLMTGLCRDLAGRGWAAWNLEYRRLGLWSGGGWPTTFDDVAAGADLLADLAAGLPLDLARVATVGHSAGGHLAVWLAGRHRLAAGAPGAGPRVRPVCAISLAGVLDLERAAREGVGGSAAARLVGGRPDQVPERYAIASPAALLPIGVRQVLVHGEGDGIVPSDLSRAHARAAQAAGDRCELVALPGVGHFEVIDAEHAAWRAAADRLPGA